MRLRSLPSRDWGGRRVAGRGPGSRAERSGADRGEGSPRNEGSLRISIGFHDFTRISIGFPYYFTVDFQGLYSDFFKDFMGFDFDVDFALILI